MPQSTPPFWGQNPLKVPLLCGFKRLSATPLISPTRSRALDSEGPEPVVSEEAEEEGVEDWDVVYKAPCGQSLRNHDDVMRFLLATESYDVLRVSWFVMMLSESVGKMLNFKHFGVTCCSLFASRWTSSPLTPLFGWTLLRRRALGVQRWT